MSELVPVDAYTYDPFSARPRLDVATGPIERSTPHRFTAGRTTTSIIHTRCRYGHEREWSPADFHAPGPRICACGQVQRAVRIEKVPWRQSRTMTLDAVERLLTSAQAVVDAISFDNNGTKVGTTMIGGNGGLYALETLKKADALRRAINAARKELQP